VSPREPRQHRPSGREPRPRQPSKREKRSRAYAAQWTELLSERNKRRTERGAPITNRKRRIVVRGPEFIYALELARDASGDPRFEAALVAAKQLGFDKEFQRNVRRVQGGIDYLLVQVEYLCTRGQYLRTRKIPNGDGPGRRKLSVREACEAVVAESGLPGTSFEAAVERLRKRYSGLKPAQKKTHA
jgi:hypothetical protein